MTTLKGVVHVMEAVKDMVALFAAYLAGSPLSSRA
jgi:hypothetical protein